MARNALGYEFGNDCLKGRVVCGTVDGDMHLKDLLGSIVRVGYCIPVLFSATWLLLPKKHYNGLINQSINHVIIPEGNNEHQWIDNISTDLISYGIQSLENSLCIVMHKLFVIMTGFY